MADNQADKNKKQTVSAEEGDVLSTVKNLWPYMWPSDRPDLKARVLLALLSLLAAMGAATFAPYFYSQVIDSLDIGNGVEQAKMMGVTLAVAFVVAYGVGNIVESLFMQLRDVLFASVGQNAVRQLARRTFVHLHALSLRYHLQRRTGGLSRVIERGTKGIETIVRFTMLNTAPTLVQFVIISTIFVWRFGLPYLGVLVITVVGYIYFTVKASNWRIGIRRKMNDSDTDANSKAIDSLLNFETVKYFGNEEMEANRFDKSMAVYEGAAIRMWTSLGFLNFGQAVIFWLGMIVISIMSVNSVLAGQITVGDFVLINMYMMQIYRPLNFIGFVYREIRQALTDGRPRDAAKLLGHWHRIEGEVIGGERLNGDTEGYFQRPAVFLRASNSMRSSREEIFGPVLVMIPYEDIDHAVEISNDSPFGLAAYVDGEDQAKCIKIAKKLRAGAVYVNGGFAFNAPFGGYKRSGNGREWGPHGLEEYLETKSILGHG